MTTRTLTKDRKVAFNYSALPPENAKAARAAAKRIEARLNEALIETGRDLIAVKKQLKHGEFAAWLRAEFGMTVRSAQRYMGAARLAAKSDIVSHLPPTALYALSASTTPEPVQKEVIKRLTAGKTPRTTEITAMIRQAKKTDVASDQPTPKVAKRKQLAHSNEEITRNPLLRFTKKTGPLIRQRRPPADGQYFWARIHQKEDCLLICEIKPSKCSGRSE